MLLEFRYALWYCGAITKQIYVYNFLENYHITPHKEISETPFKLSNRLLCISPFLELFLITVVDRH